MRKLRSDSFWHKLTPDQKSQIQHWFFVDNLSYAQTHSRMRTEMGVTCALSAIGPLYHHLSELRSHEREAILQKLTDVITEPGVDLTGIRAGSLAVINRQLLERAARRDDSGEIAALGRVLVRTEGREIERERLELMRERLSQNRAQQSGTSGQIEQLSSKQPAQYPTLSGTGAALTGINRHKPG